MKIQGMSGVLLAGGKSRRMGQDKRNVTVGESTLFLCVLSIFEEVFDEIIVVIAEESSVTENLSHKVITDEIPGKGPIGGLHAGLLHSTQSSVFLAACDMPFLQVSVIERICQSVSDINNVSQVDVAMVRLLTGIQPMQGIYSKNCIPALESMIRNNELSMQKIPLQSGLHCQFIDQTHIEDLDKNFMSFMNVNTPSDLEMANKFVNID